MPEKRSMSQINVASKYQKLQIQTTDEDPKNIYEKTTKQVNKSVHTERNLIKEYKPVLSNRNSNNSS